MANTESNSNSEAPKRSNFRIANFVNTHKSDGMDFRSQIKEFGKIKNVQDELKTAFQDRLKKRQENEGYRGR